MSSFESKGFQLKNVNICPTAFAQKSTVHLISGFTPQPNLFNHPDDIEQINSFLIHAVAMQIL